MTSAQKSALDKALTRAIAQHVEIIGKGTLKATGAACWFGTSGSGDGSNYMVVQTGAKSLTCTCLAGQRNQHYKHRGLANARMTHKAKAKHQEAQRFRDAFPVYFLGC